MWKNWQFSKIPQTCTVSQERLQPMSDGKHRLISGTFLCYSYKLILIGPGIFHRALFEKWLSLVAEKSPASAKFTHSIFEAFNVHSYIKKNAILHHGLISVAWWKTSQGPSYSPVRCVHLNMCFAILGPVLGAIWKQRYWPGQQGGPRKGKFNQK